MTLSWMAATITLRPVGELRPHAANARRHGAAQLEQIKASMLDSKDIFASAYKVVTERGNVYLMGRVTQREANRATDIARTVGSPALLVAAWLITGFMTVTAALAYGELAAMMPRAGGQYVYLREAFSPLFGFLYGVTV